MFHSATTHFLIRPEMKEECIFGEWRAAHQFCFVPGDVFQGIFEAVATPLFSIYYHAVARRTVLESKFLERANLHRSVHDFVVSFRGKCRGVRHGTQSRSGMPS